MSAAGCLQDTPVLCHAHSDMPEHTTETGFAQVRVTSEGPGAVGLCVLTPYEKRWAEQWRSAQTAAGFAGSQQYLLGPSCSGPMHGPMLAVRAVAGNVAHSGSGSGAVPKSTFERCWWRGTHGDISVDGNTKGPNSSDRWHLFIVFLVCACGLVPELRSIGCGFESQPPRCWQEPWARW